MTRTLIRQPETAKVGEVIELRVTIAHPMETGLRVDSAGRMVPQQLIRKFTCHDGDTLVFSGTFFAAVAANPSVAFHVRVSPTTRELTLRWSGDAGFDHREVVKLNLTA
jgi:sulfur-oxidizing protein SoxZ